MYKTKQFFQRHWRAGILFAVSLFFLAAAALSIYSILSRPDKLPSLATLKVVLESQKISDTEGNFFATLDNDDNFAFGVAEIGDLNDDGVVDLAFGARFDDDGGTNQGAVYICFMNTDGTVASYQKISETAGGFGGDLQEGEFGQAIANIGDLDGDGVDDLAIGERTRDQAGTNSGGLWILFMNTDGTVDSEQLITEGVGGFGGDLDANDSFGGCVVPVGDVDGDLVQDLAVCAPADDDAGTDHGAIYVLRLNTNGTVKSETKLTDTSVAGLSAEVDDSDKWGTYLTVVADLDGDSVDDWITSAVLDDDGGTNTGALYVLFMNNDATIKAYQKISNGTGGLGNSVIGNTARFGSGLDAYGDYNGDGLEDIVVGAWGDNDGGTMHGAVYLLMLSDDGTVKDWRKISDTGGGFTGQLDDNDIFGYSVAAIDDLNDDGLNDIVAGASWDDDGGTNRGAAWVLFMTRGQSMNIGYSTPSEIEVSLAGGALCTPTREVDLALTAQNATAVLIGDDRFFVDDDWQSFKANGTQNLSWTLPETDGIYMVYIKFKSPSRNLSSTYMQTIELDQATECGALAQNEPEPVETVCEPECDFLRYELYIINPDGSEVSSAGSGVKIKPMADGSEFYYFEDKGDGDFNDLILKIAGDRCGDWWLEEVELNAGWHHQVGLRVYYQNVLVDDQIIIADSHRAIGSIYQFSAEDFYPSCTGG